jgi:periplasmic protein TonB
MVPFALFAHRGEAEPRAPRAGYALDAGEKSVAAPRYSKRALYIAIAASVFLHLALFGYFAARNGANPLSPPEVKELGAEEGRPENLNVSVITEADLKSLSTVPMPQDRAVAQPEPKEVPPSPEQDQKEAATPPQKSPFQAPEDPSSFAARFADQFTASMKQAFAAAERRKTVTTTTTTTTTRTVQAAPNLRFSRPAATHSGKSDEFERAVAWALAATLPQGNGVWGSTIVSFVVAANGQVQDLRLLKSSGDKFLDTGALMAVRQARLPTPPSDLGAGDRTFHVEYISRW